MNIKRAWLIAALLILFAQNSWTNIPENGCLVAAAVYEARLYLRDAGVWTKIVRVIYWNKPDGHAYCVYAIHNGDIYAYDPTGSVSLYTKNKNISNIENALRRKDWFIYSASFLD